MGDNFPKGFATFAIHEAQDPEKWSALEVVAPLSTSTTFKQHGPAEYEKYEYSRSNNPTRETLEKVLAKLDGGKYGFCFASGLGATTTVLAMLKKGDHVVCIEDVYGGTNRLLLKVAAKFGIETTFSESDVGSFEKAIRPNTKMFWVETPTNPTLQVCDIEAVAKLAKKNNILLVVDNTFLTSYFQKPLALGADIVLYSLTKYMNGHSDVVMGAAVLNDEFLKTDLKFLQNAMGIVPSPFDCYQVLRGLKTLALRMQKHSENALVIAKFLNEQEKIESVLYPGLPSHPQYELAKKQTTGSSGMISIYLKGDLNTTKKFLKALKVFTLAESLGGYESLISVPLLMTHASVPDDQKKKLRITDNLIRLSVGLEDADDLIQDLKQALSVI